MVTNQIKAEAKDIFSKHSFLRNIVWVGEYEQKEKCTGAPIISLKKISPQGFIPQTGRSLVQRQEIP